MSPTTVRNCYEYLDVTLRARDYYEYCFCTTRRTSTTRFLSAASTTGHILILIRRANHGILILLVIRVVLIVCVCRPSACPRVRTCATPPHHDERTYQAHGTACNNASRLVATRLANTLNGYVINHRTPATMVHRSPTIDLTACMMY